MGRRPEIIKCCFMHRVNCVSVEKVQHTVRFESRGTLGTETQQAPRQPQTRRPSGVLSDAGPRPRPARSPRWRC